VLGPIAPPAQFNGQFMGDFIGADATTTTAYPIWADVQTVDEFLCPGTGTPGVRPQVCVQSMPGAAVAIDKDVYATGVPIP
jgi:hypothetical protein